MNWATLLKRTLAVDALRCPNCSSRMELIATIEDQAIAKKILEHLGLPTRGPPRPSAWTRQPSLARMQSGDPYEGIDPPSLFE